jgi:outer membrane protein OmpA-like peptidoglycan-associated protein
MTRRLASFVLCSALAVLVVACATKNFVQERISASESKLADQMTATQKSLDHEIASTQTRLTERADLQETKLRATAERTGENRRAVDENRRAVDAADQRLRSLDTRVGEVNVVAEGAKTRADSAAMSTQDAEARLAQRFAGRNKYRLVDTKSVYFGSGQIELRSQDVSELDGLARALAADPNAILELQGFADPQGGDRYNRDLARERVEAVMRYLVQRHGTELRQLQGIPMGKIALAPGEKPRADALARARRVDVRLFAPWSSWEDSQAQSEPTTPERSASPVPATAAPATAAAPSDPVEPSALPRAVLEDPPAPRRLTDMLRTITPRDLGAE